MIAPATPRAPENGACRRPRTGPPYGRTVRPRLPRTLMLGCCLALALTCAPGPAASAVPVPSAPVPTGSPAVDATAISTAAAHARIRRVLPKRTRAKALGKRFSLTVWDPRTGRYVYTKRASAQLRGASTTKVLTAVAALHSLGPDHLMPTVVKAGPTPTQIVLVGGGDPLLTSANLRSLARSTAAALVTAGVGGEDVTVRADDSLFAGSGISRGWARHWVPSEVRPVGPFARDDRETRYPTDDAGRYFARALRAAGVKARYGGEATAGRTAATLAAHPGHTIGQAVARALLVSDNDTAEMLFRQVALAQGQPSTWQGARTAVAESLTELGIPLAKVRIVDGSGLSLDGRLTAGALTAALGAALSPAHPELASLRPGLPVAGRTGTLKAAYRRFTSRPARCAAGRIQAKTGTLADAIALAGYAVGADGRTKVFVAVVNGRPTRYSRLQTRSAVDKVAASITGCW